MLVEIKRPGIAAARRAKWPPQERVLALGIAADIYNHRQMVDDQGRPASFRLIVNSLGWNSHADVDKYEKAERRIPLKRYCELMSYYFGRLMPSVRHRHPAGRLLADPAVAQLIQSGIADDMALTAYLVQAKTLAEYGQMDRKHPAVQLYDYLTRAGEEAIRKER